MQLEAAAVRAEALALESQSPYGAKWFATPILGDFPVVLYRLIAIPLRG